MKPGNYLRSVAFWCGICLFVYTASGCAADAPASSIAIGSVVPDFSLKDAKGVTHTLSQYKGKVVVVEMASQQCPYSRGVDPDLIALSQKHGSGDVVFLAIDSHNSTTVEEIAKYAGEVGKSYPILKDVDNKYADVLGAKTTPEIFLVDKEGNLAYHGAFDNREQPDKKGSTPYVENAIAAVLKGEKPSPDQVKSWGCSIKRK